MNNPPTHYKTARVKFFEVGSYPDKGFSLSEKEADAAIAQFTGAEMTLNHDGDPDGNPLKGAFGRALRIYRVGDALFAEISVPTWFYDKVTAAGRALRVSAEWFRLSKRLKRIAWVTNPRIKDSGAVAFSVVADPPAKPQTKPVSVKPPTQYSVLRPREKPKQTPMVSAEEVYRFRREATGRGGKKG